jgi:hypothetical protein
MDEFGISQAVAHEIWQRAVYEYGRPLDDVSRAELIRRGGSQLQSYEYERSEEGYKYLQQLSREMFAKEEPRIDSKPLANKASTKLLLAKAKKKKKLQLLKLA